MSVIVSVELLLDAESETRVRADAERLAAAGHSSVAAHRAASNRPHVTLLARPTLPGECFAAAGALLPIPVLLGAPVVFAHGDRGVLVRSVALTAELQALHAAVHAAAGPGKDAPHTAPGEWTPHVTLARRLRLSALEDALALLGPTHDGVGVALRRWDADTRTVTMVGGAPPP